MRADRVEIVGDDQVFGLVLKPVESMRELLVEQTSKSQVDRLDDDRDQMALGRQKRRRVARLEHETGSQPLDLDAQPVGVFMEPVIGLIRGSVPVDDAAITRNFELGIRERNARGCA